MVVKVRHNSETNAIEYKLKDSSDSDKPFPAESRWRSSIDHITRDLEHLYDALLNTVYTLPYKAQAAAVILDCKQFIKHYKTEPEANPFALRIWCNVELVHKKVSLAPPPELVILPIDATVAHLKLGVAKAFEEVYPAFQQFQAQQLLGFKNIDDEIQLHLLIGPCGAVWIRGRCIGSERRLKYFLTERGVEDWKVECSCGAKDDDGERMLACDVCRIWQHTRCSGIHEFTDVPFEF